jgi:hypothetical protein
LQDELVPLREAAVFNVDSLQPADESGSMSLVERLRAAPGRVKELLTQGAVESTRYTMAFLKSHYPNITVTKAEEGVAPSYPGHWFQEHLKEADEAAKNIVKRLGL